MTEAAATATVENPSWLARLLRFARQQPALLTLLLVCALASVRYETFLTPENLFNVLRQNSMAGLLALGMLFVMISGGIDLSLGALMAMGAVVGAALSRYDSFLAVAGALIVTTLLGLGNGFLVGQARIPSFLATLVTSMAARGALLILTREESIRVDRLARAFKWLGRGWIGPVPVPVLVFLTCYALAGFVLTRTRFGLHIYAVGDNDEAARLLGLNVPRVHLGTYAVAGGLAGLAGVLLAARLGVGQPWAGLGWELTAITAVVVGSAALTGGQGGAWSTLIGCLLLAVIFNLFNLEGSINSYWQGVLRGAFLLAVVAFQSRLKG